MVTAIRRYEFSERLAEILDLSRRDVRFRVTLMITQGLVPPGPRGPGAPPATPDYAADLLIGVLAAPQQSHTVDAIRCYHGLQPTALAADATEPGVSVGAARIRTTAEEDRPRVPLLAGRLCFGAALAHLLDHARDSETRAQLARELFGIWVSRGFPVAAVQLARWAEGRRSILTQRYELAAGGRPPTWLDPDRGGTADPGLFHSVFLPASKLIAIGALTAAPQERKRTVIELGPTLTNLANLANLARERRHRRPWQKFLATAAKAKEALDKLEERPSRLTEVTDFGSNPGNLRMLTYVPSTLVPAAGLVVVLHGCTQTAATYDYGTGWSQLAERYGFAVLLPEQRRGNNPLRCFNWFKPGHMERDAGEPLSIRQMVERMTADHGLDRSRVFVTGLSAGGAMTSVLLATYPDVFAGGAIIAAVPYKCANGLQEGFEVIFQGCERPPHEWGDRVRSASPHPGPWPKVSVWHGDADQTVKPANAEEILKQWTDVHGLPQLHSAEETLKGHRRRVWRNAAGEDVIEAYTIAGMPHGAPIAPSGADSCGAAGPFLHDVGLSSTVLLAHSWGLTTAAPAPAVAPDAEPVRERPGTASSQPSRPAPRVIRDAILIETKPGASKSGGASAEQQAADSAQEKPAAEPRPALDLQAILTQSLAAAGLLKGRGAEGTATGGGPLGIDIEAILTKSFEAAGLLKPAPEQPRSGSGGQGTVLGIDIPAILAKSFEAAGLLKGGRQASPQPAGGLAGTGWEGEGWQCLATGAADAAAGPVLFGYASSGIGCDVGSKVRSVSRRLTLGPAPSLRYVRKLDLSAAVNMLTTATFTVLVDGIAVDEVSAVGMDYAESDWTEREGIDLARFAGRTVTLTLELSANANVCLEVFAKAWVGGIRVREAVAADAL
ncbi:MAG: PHB depolymerase family esterase [Defluviicoccus sp.]